ncbi:MAG TPA: thiol reductant ABC exporter subunit CydD, partial [Pasteurellaceae bacterium]|nr:thiol reductant ABC exporter subunit CydD [Pasteurellaceae bacterium]
QILNKIHQVGPAVINNKPAGSWATIMLEQVENLHNFYARYLPQQMLAVIVPVVILIAVFPLNWIAGLILMLTAPLVPVFMILVGIAAAESSQKNMATLAHLSGQFLDRLRGLETLRLFHRAKEQTSHIENTTEHYRRTTMDVLKIAFLSSAVLEFFTSISIAIMAVYFGFSFLGQIEFGAYGSTSITLFIGFFCLILAPEFYQPLRDLGTYYHDRAAAIGAADAIVDFLEQDCLILQSEQKQTLEINNAVDIQAENLIVLSPQGHPLTEPLNFTLPARSYTTLV